MWYFINVHLCFNSNLLCFLGLLYSTLTLLLTVVFLLVATHVNGWKLTKRYGIVLMIVYIIFNVLASLYELNVFGYVHPKECPRKDWVNEEKCIFPNLFYMDNLSKLISDLYIYMYSRVFCVLFCYDVVYMHQIYSLNFSNFYLP